jgi:hypothetical protein
MSSSTAVIAGYGGHPALHLAGNAEHPPWHRSVAVVVIEAVFFFVVEVNQSGAVARPELS